MNKKGIENLIPNSKRTKEELREITTKGGIASGEARRRKKNMREVLELLLEGKAEGFENRMEAICFKQLEKAMSGDTKAFEVIRDTSGNKPAEKIEAKYTNIDVTVDIDNEE